jgi:DNA-binding transcriptional LysR family regulator
MRIRFLKTFVAVVDLGSMAAAAASLNLTPAAVGQQLRALERELGTSLVARAGRVVAPTAAGARILERARELLRGEADLKTMAVDDVLAGELRLGCSVTALTGILPSILAGLVERSPQIQVFIQPGTSADLYRAVASGNLDAAIVLHTPVALPKTCNWRTLREEPLVVLAPAAMAGRDPHELLATQPFIRYDRTQWGGHQADRYLKLNGIVPRERFELNALAAISVLVDRGLGVSLVPDWSRPWPEGLQVVCLPLPVAFEPRRMGIVWTGASIRIRLVEAFLREAHPERNISVI